MVLGSPALILVIDIVSEATTFAECYFNNREHNLGTTNNYLCHSCGYMAEVWDAPDRAPIATVDTRHCLGCKSLVEVPIEFHVVGLIEDPDVVPSFLNRCPDCNSSNVKPWDAKHTCPKCGEHMTREVAQAEDIRSIEEK